MKYILLDIENDIRLVFNSLKEIYDVLKEYTHFDVFRLVENKEGGWDIQYQLNDSWYISLMWQVYSIEEKEN